MKEFIACIKFKNWLNKIQILSVDLIMVALLSKD